MPQYDGHREYAKVKAKLSGAARSRRRALNPDARRCEQPGCDKPHEARGLCRYHYRAWARSSGKQWAKEPTHRAPARAKRTAWKNLIAGRSHGIAQYKDALLHDACAYCGQPVETIDHITPRSDGGDNDWSNLTGACRSCNSAKGSRTLLGHLLVLVIERDLDRLLNERSAACAL